MPKHNQAPIDPGVKIPEAVRRGAAASDTIHGQVYIDPNAPPADPNAPPADPNAPPATPPADPNAPPATPPVTPPAEPADEGSWENRYKAMKGRHDKLLITAGQQQDTIANQGQRLQNLENMMTTMQAPPPAAAAPNPELDAAALSADRETFGDDFMNAVRRQAETIVKPMLEARDAKIADLTRQLGGVASSVAVDARQKMFDRLDEEVPTWRELNNDPQFLAWLRLQDPFSGAIRGTLLKEASNNAQADRVLAFFKGFLTEEATVAPQAPAAPAPNAGGRPSLEDLAAPGRAKSAATPPAGSPEKPIITRAQVSEFYVNVRLGKYDGQDAKRASDEAMIFEAQRDGRIR